MGVESILALTGDAQKTRADYSGTKSPSEYPEDAGTDYLRAAKVN